MYTSRQTGRVCSKTSYHQFTIATSLITFVCLPPPHTLGARGFSCAVSGFVQVLKSDPREKLRPSCLRPSDEHVSACGRRNEAPRRTREKTSGTQGTHHNKSCIILVFNFSWLLKASQDKLKKTLVQTFGQQRRCIMNSYAGTPRVRVRTNFHKLSPICIACALVY